MSTDDYPTRTERARPPDAVPNVAPARGAVTFSQVATEGGVLAIECRGCNKRTVLTKADCPHIRPGNGAYVLHMRFGCTRCGADHPRLYRATRDDAQMFLASDRLPARQQIGG